MQLVLYPRLFRLNEQRNFFDVMGECFFGEGVAVGLQGSQAPHHPVL